MDLVLKDGGGEHVSAIDMLGSTSSHASQEHEDIAMQIDPDYDEGPDERNESPALFLRKHWRKVSPEPATFDCFRSPKSESLCLSSSATLGARTKENYHH